MDKLWTPTKAHERRVRPGSQKREGGSYFDDELPTERATQTEVMRDRKSLIDHIKNRPDHDIMVASIEQREQMRAVFNDWFKRGVIGHHPTIKVDYGVPDGAIRVGDGR